MKNTTEAIKWRKFAAEFRALAKEEAHLPVSQRTTAIGPNGEIIFDVVTRSAEFCEKLAREAEANEETKDKHS